MSHGDYTGQRKSELARQYSDQQAAEARRLSMVTQVADEISVGIIDLTEPAEPQEVELLDKKGEPTGEFEIIEVDVNDPLMEPVIFRAREDVEEVTLGKDKTYTLKAGQQYTLEAWKVKHLDDVGLVYH